jgi:hypothetical protein
MAKSKILIGRGRHTAQWKGPMVYFTVHVARMNDESEHTIPVKLNNRQTVKTSISIINMALNYKPDRNVELWTEFHNTALPVNDMIKDYVQDGDLLMVLAL